MDHLERAATIIGTILIGVAAYLIVSERKKLASTKPPVDKLAADLKNAWSGYHTP